MIENIREQKIFEITYKRKGVDVTESFAVTQLGGRSGNKYWNKILRQEMDDDGTVSLICESLSITEKQFDERFAGKTACIRKLLDEIIEFNYSDLFLELGLEEK